MVPTMILCSPQESAVSQLWCGWIYLSGVLETPLFLCPGVLPVPRSLISQVLSRPQAWIDSRFAPSKHWT